MNEIGFRFLCLIYINTLNYTVFNMLNIYVYIFIYKTSTCLKILIEKA